MMWIRATGLGLAAFVMAACGTSGIGGDARSGDVASPSASASPTVTSTPGPTAAASVGSSPSPSSTPSATPDASCPPPVTVPVLGGWTEAWPSDRLADCFGSADLEVTGYLAHPWGIGGVGHGVVPTWLGEWSGLESVLWIKPNPTEGCSGDDCGWLFLYAPDASALPLSPDRWVALTGHFDDPLAQTCRATAPEGSGYPSTDAEAIAECRMHFVVTEIRTIPPPAP